MFVQVWLPPLFAKQILERPVLGAGVIGERRFNVAVAAMTVDRVHTNPTNGSRPARRPS